MTIKNKGEKIKMDLDKLANVVEVAPFRRLKNTELMSIDSKHKNPTLYIPYNRSITVIKEWLELCQETSINEIRARIFVTAVKDENGEGLRLILVPSKKNGYCLSPVKAKDGSISAYRCSAQQIITNFDAEGRYLAKQDDISVDVVTQGGESKLALIATLRREK